MEKHTILFNIGGKITFSRKTNKLSVLDFTLVNVYVALPVFTPVCGRSYAHFMEQNGGVKYVNSEFGRYFHFCWC